MGADVIAYLTALAASGSGIYIAYQRGRQVQRQVLVDLATAVDQRTERLLARLDEQLERLEAQNVEQRRRIREQADQLDEAQRLLRRMRDVVQRLVRELRKHDGEGAARLERELQVVVPPPIDHLNNPRP